MKHYVAYLAGPITGVSFDNATDWREKFIELINTGAGAGRIDCMSPLRGKYYLQHEHAIADSYEDTPLCSSRGIMTRDYNDCKRCDVLVAYLVGADRVSIGTVMEIAWAKAFQIPVIAVMEKSGNLHDHSMIRESIGFRVETLDEAVYLTKVLLLPSPHRSRDII